MTCKRCGRVLTDPQSIKDGIGPICKAKENWDRQQDLFGKYADVVRNPLSGPGDIWLERKDGVIYTNVPHQTELHSPDGYEWGYGGSGPADLALNILLLFVPEERARILHQAFKWDVLSRIRASRFLIPESEIHKWLLQHRAKTLAELAQGV